MFHPNKHDFWVLGVWSMWKSPSKHTHKWQGFPGTQRPFLTHNMARPPADFCAARLRGHRRCKIPDATLSGIILFLSIEAMVRVIDLFLPHIMAAYTRWQHQGKKGEKRTRHVMRQDHLRPCAVFTETSEGFAPYYLAGIRHDLSQTTHALACSRTRGVVPGREHARGQTLHRTHPWCGY